MKKLIPFRATKTKQGKKPRTLREQPPPLRHAEEEEDLIMITTTDGTSEMISGRNLELDMEYQHGIPYLVVRKKGERQRTVREVR